LALESGSHGGMKRLCVTSTICAARFFTSAYESSANGAASPG
jgi:hypothetical protein